MICPASEYDCRLMATLRLNHGQRMTFEGPTRPCDRFGPFGSIRLDRLLQIWLLHESNGNESKERI